MVNPVTLNTQRFPSLKIYVEKIEVGFYIFTKFTSGHSWTMYEVYFQS